MPRVPLSLVFALVAGPLLADDKPTPPGPNGPNGPLAPAAATTALRIADGFALGLVAHEPAVVDPVALCFDAKGRLYVCEMPGYPNRGLATGGPEGGRIKRFEDKDGDGTFETSTLFATGLRYPTGLTPYKTGLIVADAPEIVYLDDPDDDGVADTRTAWYAGFDLANIQALPNALQWGPDNLIYGMVPGGTGVVTSPQVPTMEAVPLRARGFRFDPAKPGSFEATSGGGQYGLTRDAFGHWFTSTNSQQLRQVVVPDHYARRNPDLAVPATTLDIPDHGASAKVFRLSPPEAWRQERTDRRLQGVGTKAALPSTELVSAGYTSSTCSPVVYDADLFPPAYRGTAFVCDPGNNLLHRTRLEPDGAVFVARRADPDRQFLAATDNWFRPVFLALAPDGSLYLCDFYREVIETPLSIPEDIKARLVLESRDRGRVWRIAPTDAKPAKLPDLAAKTDAQLAQDLLSTNQWVRTTARRLLVERGARVRGGAALAAKAAGTTGLPDVLSATAKLGGLTNEIVASTLADPLPGNREVALRFAEPRLFDPTVRAAAVRLAADPSAMVRFQLALSAGELPDADRPAVLATLADSDGESPWTRAAILSSAQGGEAGLATRTATTPSGRAVARQAAGVVGARGDAAEVARVLAAAADGDPDLLDALARGMKAGAFAKLLAAPPAAAGPAVEKLRAFFDDAAKAVAADDAPPAARVAAARALGFAPAAVPALTGALGKPAPGEVQTAVIRALAGHPAAAGAVAAAWPKLSPAARTAAADVLAATPAGATALLDAVAAGKVRPAEVGAARAAALRTHRDAAVRTRAGELLPAGSKARAGVVADYKAALALKGDAAAGAVVFKAQCAACHKLGAEGHEVGPNLLAVVPGKTGDDLLASILDPNKEVDGRYIGYVATLADGRTLTGVVAAETAAGVTLKRADGAEDAIRRADLDALTSTGLSLMPEGMEQQLSKQQMADLIAHLRAATRPR